MSSVFKIFSPEDCDFYYEGELQGHIKGNSDISYKFWVYKKGTYRVSFINTRYKSELKMDLTIDRDEVKIVDLDFTEVNSPYIEVEKKKEEKKKIEEQRLHEIKLTYQKVHISYVGSFSEGLARFQRDCRWGFLDKTGGEVITNIYDNVGDFSEGLARVESSGKWGYIDHQGNQVISCKFSEAGDFSRGLAYVRNGKYGYFIDRNSTELTPRKYFLGEKNRFSEDLMKVYGNAGGDVLGWGYIDTSGREVISCQYMEAEDFSEGYARIRKTFASSNFIDKNGKELLKRSYPYCSNKFSEGLAWIGYEDQKRMEWNSEINFMLSLDGEGPFYSDEKIMIFYFIDKTGRMALGPYEDVRDFSEGLAGIKKGGKWGFIDKDGNEVIPCNFDQVGNFSEGIVAVGKRNGIDSTIWGFIDRNGNEVVPYKYCKQPQDFHHGLTMVCRGANRYGFVNRYGNEVIPLKYQHCSNKSISEGLLVLSREDRWRFVDENGQEIYILK